MSAVIAIRPQPTKYVAPHRWMDNPVRVVVIGAGGNGSEVVDTLATFHLAMISLGHLHGLEVTIIDDAVVRESNLVRQRFWPQDLGQFKAIALANRFNLLMGMDWVGIPAQFPSSACESAMRNADLIITCVDVNSARLAVAQYEGGTRHDAMWLDMGNAHRHGQAVFGGLSARQRERFPNVLDEYPEIAEMKDSTTKSCSAAESIATQDCLVNRSVATAAMNIVWEVLRKGETIKHWVVLDLESGEQATHPFPWPRKVPFAEPLPPLACVEG